MAVVGVDDCKSGWFAVRLGEGEKPRIDVFPKIGALWAAWHDASLILIDVPIGLPDAHKLNRKCDIEARKILGSPRQSSVFPPPCWAALATDVEKASQANYEVTGKYLTRQALGILPKIREVNYFLRENGDARSRICEVHPEVCFWAFAEDNKPMTARKKKPDGQVERLNVLRRVDEKTTDTILESAQKYHDGVAKDDVLDALVAAFTAQSSPDELASIPQEPERDAYGLPMEMVYRRPRSW